jgi:Ser/Thr protein kinase RdoA (MazF antagonist)
MDVTSALLQKYWPLSGVVLGEILQRGSRTVGTFKAAEGTFTYKIANETKTAVSLSKDLHVFDFLRTKQFPNSPFLLKTNQGELFHSEDKSCVYVLEYIEGNHPTDTPDSWAKLGGIIANLHSIEGYPYVTEFDVDFIAKNHLKDRAEKVPAKDEFMALVRSLPSFNNLPKALIHTDSGPGNSIERTDGTIVLIDWDDIGMGPAILDIAFPLIQYFVTEDLEFKEENARAFYGTYFEKRKMTQEEKEMIFSGALFFALDYIIYGDMQKRWERIKWALQNKSELTAVY